MTGVMKRCPPAAEFESSGSERFVSLACWLLFSSSFFCGRALRRASLCLNAGLVMNGSSAGSFRHSQSSSNRDEKRPNRHEENVFTDADEFPRAVAKTAVAQICEATGFHSIQLSALEALADIAIRYLYDTGKASQFYANLAGRTQSNALDALCAVEDANGSGLTHAHKAMSTSDTPSELKRYVDYTEEIPFCKPVPHFPVRKRRALTPSFSQFGEKPPGGHIPPWLPAFPDVHTYKATPLWNERKVDPRADKAEQAKQRRKAEKSLVDLHFRLSAMEASSSAGTTSNKNVFEGRTVWGVPSSEPLYSSGPSESDQQQINKGGPTASVQNLSTPLPAGAKEVSAVTLNGSNPSMPASKENKKDLPLPSILEAFTPALEAATLTVQETTGAGTSSGGGLSASKRRMPHVMDFDFGRKANQKAVLASLLLGGKDKKRGLPELKDDEKDEKKKRAQQILAQSFEGTDVSPNDTRNRQQ